MKKIVMASLIAVAVFQTGCTAYKVATHNDRVAVARQMVQIAPQSNMGIAVGIDLAQIGKMQDGYLGAWKSDFGGMLTAHITDALIVGGGAYLYDRARDSKTVVSEVEQPATYESNADTVIINRDGVVTYTTVAGE